MCEKFFSPVIIARKFGQKLGSLLAIGKPKSIT